MKCCRRQIQGNTPRESSNPITSLSGFTFGWVQFRSADSYTKASNLLLLITTKPPKDAFLH